EGGGRHQGLVERVVRQVPEVDVRGADLLGDLGRSGPRHGVGVVCGEVRHRGTPRPRPDDRNSDPHGTTVRSALMAVRCAVLVPVKSFTEAKVRLAPALDVPSRAVLARQMAGVVVAAAAPLPVAVVCDDPEVAELARGEGAEVFWRPERGLNGAVADGVAAMPSAASSGSSSPTPTSRSPPTSVGSATSTGSPSSLTAATTARTSSACR